MEDIREETPVTDPLEKDENSGASAPETAGQDECCAEENGAAAETEDTAEAEDAGESEEEPDAGQDAADISEEAQEKTGDDRQAGGMGLFGRKKKDKRDEQIEELKDRVQRQMAEFDNFRKRTEKEKAGMYEIGAKSVIEKILPVVDNFERGLETVDQETKDPFVVGMQKIYRQMMTTLEELEVRPIEAVGKEFNPDYHNAVLHVEDETVGENIIVDELQKGYMYRDSVVRHSMVKVAN